MREEIKHIFLRADGGNLIGNGHWSRSLQFLENLPENITIHLYTKNAKEFDIRYSTSRKIEVIEIVDEQQFIDNIDNDIVVLDGYFFNKDYFLALSKKNALSIFISDIPQKDVIADVIINHNPGISYSDYSNPALYTSIYAGAKYSLVSSLVTPGEKWDKNNVLVCMGAADPNNYLEDILIKNKSFLVEYDNVYVVLGPFNRNRNELLQQLSDIKNYSVYDSLNKLEMASLMQKCKTAILPASIMAIEYCHVTGLLAILKTVDNQDFLYQGLLESGVAIKYEDLINQEINRVISKQRELFDGRSNQRFSKLLEGIILQKSVKIKKAEIQYALDTFSWANDKIIRKYSFSKQKIDLNEHLNWYSSKITDPNCCYYLAFINNEAIGSIRFDIKDDIAVISYLICPEWQGNGLGRVLLSLGMKELLNEKLNLKYINGYVLPENSKSCSVFTRMGFKKFEQSNGWLFSKKVK